MNEFISQNRRLIIIFIVALIIGTVIRGVIEGLSECVTIPRINNIKYKIKQYFFQYHEKDFYTNLKKALYYNYGFKYEVYPKVRLSDIFEPEEGYKTERRYFINYVDFLIVDKDQYFTPKLAIDLDFNKKSLKTDKLKTTLFKGTKLNYIKFKDYMETDYDNIQKMLVKNLGVPTKTKE